MMHIRMILEKGVPIMPSGLVIRHGFLYAYAGAASAWLFGLSPTTVRLPSLLISLPTLLLLYHIGRRWFNPRVGLLAALLLALSPEAIGWGGQARMYALWQFCTLAAVYLLYEGLLRDRSTAIRVWGLLALTGAMLSQVRTLLTLPSLIVGLLAAWWLTRHRGEDTGWRPRHLPWAELASLSLLVLATSTFFLFERRIPVTSHAQIQPENWVKPTHLFTDLLIGAQQFLIPPYLFLTVLAMSGSLALLLRLMHHKPGPHDPAFGFLSVVGLVTLVEFSLVSPVNIRVPRYLFDMLPLYFLVVAREADFWIAELQKRLKGTIRAAFGLLPVLLIVALFAGPALRVITTQRSAARPALEYVRDHLQPGDRIASRLPALPYQVVGRCDYFVALANPFLWDRDTGPVDPHLGLPWIGTAEGLLRIADESPRLWIIAEERYAAPYRTLLGEQLTTAFEQLDTVVFLVEKEP